MSMSWAVMRSWEHLLDARVNQDSFPSAWKIKMRSCVDAWDEVIVHFYSPQTMSTPNFATLVVLDAFGTVTMAYCCVVVAAIP